MKREDLIDTFCLPLSLSVVEIPVCVLRVTLVCGVTRFYLL